MARALRTHARGAPLCKTSTRTFPRGGIGSQGPHRRPTISSRVQGKVAFGTSSINRARCSCSSLAIK